MKLKNLLLVTLTVFTAPAFGQALSIQDCIDYAYKNNGSMINAKRDIEIADRKIKETAGTMLPQVDASASYTNNLKLTTTLLPGAMVGDTTGRMIPVQFGTQHNFNSSLQINQKIFDPTFGVALKAAKVSQNQADQSLKMTKEQLSYSVVVTYYQTLVIGKQRSTLLSTLRTSSKQLDLAKLRLNNGVLKQLDVDKIQVSYNNLQSQFQQSELSYNQSLNNLKYYMGMPVTQTIALKDTILNLEDQLLGVLQEDFNLKNRTDYQLQEINLQAYQLDKKRNQATYLPTFNVALNMGLAAMRKQFNFFEANQGWYDNASLVFSLKLPVFDGLQKHQRIVQSKLNVDKAETKLAQMIQSIQVDIANYENQYRNAVTNIKTEKDNMTLAENVYKSTQLAYQQGTANSLDIVQAESAYNESMNTYYSKLLNLYVARVNLEQSRGNLLNYIKK
jgi:outer membrane protein TolC